MTEEDEEFNRIEREAAMRKEAVAATIAKREWVGFTDEEVAEVELWVEFKEEGSGRIPTGKLIRYIDNKLKEKNGM